MLAVSVLLSPAEAGSLLLVACTQRLRAGLIPAGAPRLGPAKSVVRNLFCVERIFPGIDRMKKRGLPAAKTAHSALQQNGTLGSAAKRAHSALQQNRTLDSTAKRAHSALQQKRHTRLCSKKGTLDGVPSLPSIDSAPANAFSARARHDGDFFRAQTSGQFIFDRALGKLASPALALDPNFVQEAMFASITVKDELAAVCRVQ
jgi:hypothetical protein